MSELALLLAVLAVSTLGTVMLLSELNFDSVSRRDSFLQGVLNLAARSLRQRRFGIYR